MKRRNFIKISSAGVLGVSALGGLTLNAMAASQSIPVTVPKTAKFVWYDTKGEGRNLFGLFRKSFTLNDQVSSATLNLFADTSYQLFVNGKFIHFGPVRFDPRFPMYDSYDLKPHLQQGNNVIAVQAVYYGCKTYKAIPARASMIAWGEIVAKGQKISLETNAKNWKVTASATNARYVNKYNIMLNPGDLYDQSGTTRNWTAIDFDDSQWLNPTILEKQDTWGVFAQRFIPLMSLKEMLPYKTLSILPLKQSEDLYSFSMPIPKFYDDDNNFNPFIAFSTWILSPKDQTITMGTYWSETWLNGKELPRGFEPADRSMRLNRQISLNTGWNYFFGKVGAYQDILNYYLAFPKEAGIKIAADKMDGSNRLFRHSPLLTKEQFANSLKNKPLPYPADSDLKEIGGWIYTDNSTIAQSPCFETDWDNYGEPLENVVSDKLAGKIFKLQDYPNGFSILFDLNHTRLVFPQIDIHGVEGATIDLTYNEYLNDDGKHLRHYFNYWWGDRVLCTENSIKWFPSHPRGTKYLKLTFRNTKNDIKINKISLLNAGYPVQYRGEFNCSDGMLNEIWQMCKRTQEVNMEDAYVDCVTRERGMYLRDTIIQYHNNLALFGDQALMKRCLELYGQSPDATGKFRAVYPNTGDYTIADFSLNGLEGFLAYFQNTGDTELIIRYWDAIMGNLNWFNKLADQRSDLLLDAEWDKKMGVKAHYGGFHGDLNIVKDYMDNTGIHCVFSCTYLIALECAVKLANAIGRNADASPLQQRIDILKKSIPATFWDDEKQSFADNDKKTTYSVHASLFAGRAGVIASDKLESVKKHVAYELRSLFANGYSPEAGTFTSPSFAFYIFDGLYKLDLPEVAQNMMRTGWGWMLFQGYKTCKEYFSRSVDSLCHAWSASPAYYLSKNVLGVNYPQAPDLSKVEIKVKAPEILWAEGKFPHPQGGEIEIKWHTEQNKRVFDYVKAPNGVNITIVS